MSGNNANAGAGAAMTWNQTLEALLGLVDAACEIEINVADGPFCRLRGAVVRVVTEPSLGCEEGETVVLHASDEDAPRVMFAAADFVAGAWADAFKLELEVVLKAGAIRIEDRRPAAVALAWERRLGDALLQPSNAARSSRLALLGVMAHRAATTEPNAFVAGKLAALTHFLDEHRDALLAGDDPN